MVNKHKKILSIIYIRKLQTASQDGGIGKHSLPSTGKITTRLQNKYHPESSENRAVRKSNNQGIKEATFIQIGRRGRDPEKHGGMQRGAEMWNGWPHTHI